MARTAVSGVADAFGASPLSVTDWTQVNTGLAGDVQTDGSGHYKGQYGTQATDQKASAYWVGSGAGSVTDDQYAATQIVNDPDGAGSANQTTAGVAVRMSGSGATKSMVEAYVDADVSALTRLVKWVSGTRYQIASSSAINWAAGDYIVLECVGQVYTVSKGTSEAGATAIGGSFTYTDDGTTNGAAITSGAVGIVASGTGILGDDFTGGNVSSAAAPVITGPTGTATGPTQATIGVTTDTAPGTTTISYQILPAADAAPSASTIVASPTGTITTGSVGALTKAITTLTTNTAVKVHFAQGSTSNVVSSASFTPNTLAIAGTALSSQTGTAGSAFTWSGSTPESLITNTGNGSGSWTATSGIGASGCTVNSTSGILVSSTLGTAGSYTVTLQRTDGSTVPSAQTVTKTVGLVISASGAATAVTMSGPSSGVVSVASTNFTVGADGTITGTVVVTPSDSSGGGTFTPSSVSISSGSPTGTFTYTPGSTGSKTISVTNNGSLSNPSNITYTVSSAARTVSFALTTNGTSPAADLSGLKWAFFDEVTPNLFNAPTAQGTGATTDSSGTISITITGTSLTAGQIGWLILTDSNGTVTQNPPAKAFSGPVTIS